MCCTGLTFKFDSAAVRGCWSFDGNPQGPSQHCFRLIASFVALSRLQQAIGFGPFSKQPQTPAQTWPPRIRIKSNTVKRFHIRQPQHRSAGDACQGILICKCKVGRSNDPVYSANLAFRSTGGNGAAGVAISLRRQQRKKAPHSFRDAEPFFDSRPERLFAAQGRRQRRGVLLCCQRTAQEENEQGRQDGIGYRLFCHFFLRSFHLLPSLPLSTEEELLAESR